MKMWRYYGYNVYPATANSSGIRWYAYVGDGVVRKSDTKNGMRKLLREVKK